jgi:hypothetical protein
MAVSFSEALRILGWFGWVVSLLAALYAVSVVVFIVLENRSPQMTFSWLLLFYALPVVGVIIYLMFGRDHWAFSRQNKLMRQKLRHIVDTSDHLAQLAAQQEAEIDKLRQAHRFMAGYWSCFTGLPTPLFSPITAWKSYKTAARNILV